MNTRRGAFAERPAIERGVDLLFVERMTGLVDGSEERLEWRRADAGGDADVARREADHERVVGEVLSPALEVVAE